MDLLLLPAQVAVSAVFDNNKHVKVALCIVVAVVTDVEVEEETNRNLGCLARAAGAAANRAAQIKYTFIFMVLL